MKTLLLVVMLMVSGCQPTGSPMETDSSVCKSVDKANGVVCYFNCIFTSQSGISCVKVEGAKP